MSEDQPTPKPPDGRSTWSGKIPTWFAGFRASEVKARAQETTERQVRDDKAATERQVRDDRADDRVDKWAERALSVAEANLKWSERMVRYQWAIIFVLIMAFLVLAGHTVFVEVSKDGTVIIEADG